MKRTQLPMRSSRFFLFLSLGQATGHPMPGNLLELLVRALRLLMVVSRT